MTQRVFLAKVAGFLSLVGVAVLVLWILVTWSRMEICNNDKATILVMGNSRVQYGFDDSFAPGSWNSAVNADNYNVIYWRLKLLHRYNPQLKTVWLLCDQTEIFGYFSGIPDKLHPYYWDVMSFDDWIGLIKNDRLLLNYSLNWMKLLWPLYSFFAKVKYVDFGFGGYSDLDRDKLHEALTNNRHTDNRHFLWRVNDYNVEYLRRIVNYCNNNGLRVVFFNMPSYPTDDIIYGNRRLHEYVEKNYPEISFYDYELTSLPDSCYGDISHLNYRGARIISETISKDM